MKTLKTITAIFISVLFLYNNSTAQTASTTTLESNFTVKYTGVEGDYRFFSIEISGIDIKDKTLRINDKVEGELYVESISKTNTIKKYKIERKEGQVLIFNLVGGNKEYSKTYSFSTQLTESTVVKEDDLVIL